MIMESSKHRVRAHIVGIGKPGGPITWLAPGKEKFIKINWYVLFDFIKMMILLGALFSCGVLTGLFWGQL